MGLLHTIRCNTNFFTEAICKQWKLIAYYFELLHGWPSWAGSGAESGASHLSVAANSAVNRVQTVLSEETSKALYTPLTGPHAIRLIQIHGRDPSGYIACSIRVAHILQDLFIAVSYVWGVESPSYKVIINGEPVLVRPNLFSFLSLVADGKNGELLGREIWIDALCINQIDKLEKQGQIPHMGVIFEEATDVVSWLHGPALHHGPDPNGPQSLIAALHDEVELVHGHDTVIGNLIRLSEHEYWSRLWIVQEMYLAKRLYIYWQGQVIYWPQLQEFLLAKDDEANCSVWKRPNVVDESHIGAASKASVRRFLTLLQGCFSARNHLVESKRPLKRLILDHKRQDCLELYDRVFALLALSEDRSFTPSYEMEALSLLACVMLGCKELPDLDSVSGIGRMLGIDPNTRLQVDYLGSAISGEKAKWLHQTSTSEKYGVLEICASCETADQLHVACFPGTDFFFAFDDRRGLASKVVKLEFIPRVELKTSSSDTNVRVLHFGIPCQEIEGMTNVLFEYDRHAEPVFLKEGWSGLCNLFRAIWMSRYSPSLQSRKASQTSTLRLSSRRRSSVASCRYSVLRPVAVPTVQKHKKVDLQFPLPVIDDNESFLESPVAINSAETPRPAELL